MPFKNLKPIKERWKVSVALNRSTLLDSIISDPSRDDKSFIVSIWRSKRELFRKSDFSLKNLADLLK